jgi:hypothetical protein
MPSHHLVHHLALNLLFFSPMCFIRLLRGFVYIILEERDTWETVISESRRVRLFSEQTLSFSPVYRKFFSTLPCLIYGMNQQMYHSTPCGDGLLLSSLFPWAIKSTQPPALYILSTRHILPTRTMTE